MILTNKENMQIYFFSKKSYCMICQPVLSVVGFMQIHIVLQIIIPSSYIIHSWQTMFVGKDYICTKNDVLAAFLEDMIAHIFSI